jgi:hypothetical protein
MSDEEFLYEIKRIVANGEKNHMKVIRKLKELGFKEVGGGKRGHYFFTHRRLGNYKACIGSSVSNSRWGLNFVREIRHAMWKAAA